MVDEESITESEETAPEFVGRDILESYIYCINHTPINPLDRYQNLVKSITFGMELLPVYNDPDETDTDPEETYPEEKQKNKKKQEKIDTLYAEAAERLKTEIPAKRKVEYSYVDFGNVRPHVYKIQSFEDSDAKEYQVLEKDYTEGMNGFITQQHEQHISKLQAVHNKILHVLTDEGIVPVVNPTLETVVKEEIKIMHKEMMGAPEPEYEEVNKNGEEKR